MRRVSVHRDRKPGGGADRGESVGGTYQDGLRCEWELQGLGSGSLFWLEIHGLGVLSERSPGRGQVLRRRFPGDLAASQPQDCPTDGPRVQAMPRGREGPQALVSLQCQPTPWATSAGICLLGGFGCRRLGGTPGWGQDLHPKPSVPHLPISELPAHPGSAKLWTPPCESAPPWAGSETWLPASSTCPQAPAHSHRPSPAFTGPRRCGCGNPAGPAPSSCPQCTGTPP